MTQPRVRDAHCSYCGAAFSPPLAYPRTCPQCATTTWANPIPVSVVLVPVRRGGDEALLVVRRSIEPKKGLLALTGGFLEEHETWQEGGTREVWEETQVRLDPATLSTFWFTSTRPKPNRVLLFSLAAPLDASALKPFQPTNETSERGLVFGPEGLDALFAFDLHVEAVKRFFASRDVRGPHRYTPA
ncbi:MAG: NUDIX domain-containing protein [Myxococcaceae bacterium]